MTSQQRECERENPFTGLHTKAKTQREMQGVFKGINHSNYCSFLKIFPVKKANVDGTVFDWIDVAQ